MGLGLGGAFKVVFVRGEGGGLVIGFLERALYKSSIRFLLKGCIRVCSIRVPLKGSTRVF